MLQAVAAKAADGALPYGAPEGGTGTAAYSLTLAGVTGEADGNAARGGAALALLALASASGFFVRRRFAG
jgi:putative membrane protein